MPQHTGGATGGSHVAKIVEISAESARSFEDAVSLGVQRASKTLKNVQSAWVKEQKVLVEGGKITSYRVHMMVTFILDE